MSQVTKKLKNIDFRTPKACREGVYPELEGAEAHLLVSDFRESGKVHSYLYGTRISGLN